MGEKLEISGRVQSRNYQKKIGEQVVTKTAYEISINSIMIAEENTSLPIDNIVIMPNDNTTTVANI